MTLEHVRVILESTQGEMCEQEAANELTCEWMVHPGFPCDTEQGGCGTGPDDFSQDAARRHEFDLLRSDEVRELFKLRRVRLSPFRESLK